MCVPFYEIDASARFVSDRKASAVTTSTSSAFVNHRSNSQSPISQPVSSKLPQSSPTFANQLPANSTAVSFIRPFEDNYATHSHSPSKATKNSSFLSSFSDGVSTQSAAGFNAVHPVASTKLTQHYLDCFSLAKTPDSALTDPPSARLSSHTSSSYLTNAGAAELNCFQPVNSVASSSSHSAAASFKPFTSYPYDLIQYPPFKNHLVDQAALSPPLPKKARAAPANDEITLLKTDVAVRSSRSNRSAAVKTRAKNAKSNSDKRKNVVCFGDSNSTPLNLSTSDSVDGENNANAAETDTCPNTTDINKASSPKQEEVGTASLSVAAEVN